MTVKLQKLLGSVPERERRLKKEKSDFHPAVPPVNQGRWAGHSTPLTPAWRRDIILAFIYPTLISCDFIGHNVKKDVSRHLKKNETFSSLKTTCHTSQKEGTEKGKMAQ